MTGKHTIILDKKTGKPKARSARLPPVLAAGKRHKADRIEKRLRENAAKSKGDP